MASATDNFDSYSDGSSLNDAANWTVNQGSFTIVNPTASAGAARSNTASTICLARYNATSFNSDQACEVVIGGSSGVHEHGPAVRVQSGAVTGYYAYGDNTAVYLVAIVSGTYIYEAYGSTFTPGDIVRIEAKGAGSSARVSLYVDHGSGFSAIVEDYDFGSGYYIDNGDPGIAGYSASYSLSITDWLGEDLANSDGDVDFTTDDITFSATGEPSTNSDGDVDFTTDDITFTALAGWAADADVDFTTDDITFSATGGPAGAANVDFTTDAIDFLSIAGPPASAVVDFTTDVIDFLSNGNQIQNPEGEVYFVTDDITMHSSMFLIEISNIPSPWRTSNG